MKRAALAVVVAVLLLSGCAGGGGPSPSAPPSEKVDPFVGTWRLKAGDHPRFVISRDGDSYAVVQGMPGEGHYLALGSFTRRGDQLTGTISAPNEGEMTLTLYRQSPGRMQLRFQEAGKTDSFLTQMRRSSRSTATPTPVP